MRPTSFNLIMKPTRILSLLCLIAFVGVTPRASAKLNVIATTPDFGALAQEVGGDLVKVHSLAIGSEDPHFVDAKPSFIRILNQADVLIEGGAELEIGWLPPLVNNARNPKILSDAPGHIIASRGVALREVPTQAMDRSHGDVHPLGNPHYLLDPDNAKVVAATLAQTFSQLDPAHAETFQANARRFEARLATKMAEWEKALGPFRGTPVVTYHKSFDYFLERFGFKLVGTIEPKPGIEPSPTHISALIPEAKAAGTKLVLIEPCRPRRTPQQVTKALGATLLVLPLMPGGNEKATDFFSWVDYNVSQICAALKP